MTNLLKIQNDDQYYFDIHTRQYQRIWKMDGSNWMPFGWANLQGINIKNIKTQHINVLTRKSHYYNLDLSISSIDHLWTTPA